MIAPWPGLLLLVRCQLAILRATPTKALISCHRASVDARGEVRESRVSCCLGAVLDLVVMAARVRATMGAVAVSDFELLALQVAALADTGVCMGGKPVRCDWRLDGVRGERQIDGSRHARISLPSHRRSSQPSAQTAVVSLRNPPPSSG